MGKGRESTQDEVKICFFSIHFKQGDASQQCRAQCLVSCSRKGHRELLAKVQSPQSLSLETNTSGTFVSLPTMELFGGGLARPLWR